MKALIQDITKTRDVEVIVNAANGKGPLGAGVAGAIGRAGGEQLKREVMKICQEAGGYKEGDCYISSPGDLGKRGIKAIYHCVTMEFPGGRTSLDTVGNAMRTTIEKAIQNGVKSIVFPGLGTGIGCLNPKSVASVMVNVAKKYSAKIDITFCDVDPMFIGFVRQSIDQVEKGVDNEKLNK